MQKALAIVVHSARLKADNLLDGFSLSLKPHCFSSYFEQSTRDLRRCSFEK